MLNRSMFIDGPTSCRGGKRLEVSRSLSVRTNTDEADIGDNSSSYERVSIIIGVVARIIKGSQRQLIPFYGNILETSCVTKR